MKRILASALVLSAITGFGLVGCGDTTKTETETKSSGPGGTVDEKHTDSVTKTGNAAADPAVMPPTTPPKP